MNEIWTAAIPIIISILTALGAYIVSRLNAKRAKEDTAKLREENVALKEKIDALDEFLASDDTEYYVTCPRCGKEICLNKLKIIARRGE